MNDRKMWFYNIDVDYLKFLHGIDSKVQFSQGSGYNTKPFLGGFRISGSNYFIPLSSPKDKHISWDYEGDTYFMICETIREEDRTPKNVIRQRTEDGLEKILAVLYLNNMIPVPEKYCQCVGDFLSNKHDKYCDLLRKEYKFCLGIYDDIVRKAQKLYDAQKEAGTVNDLCCNFVKMEQAMKNYRSYAE